MSTVSSDPPAEEAELQHMQQAGDVLPAAEQDGAGRALGAEALQLPVVLEPEPAEHLDHDGRQNHEADQHPEPEEVPAAVKFGGQPHVRAPVQQECAHSDHGENKVEPGVLGETRALHDRLTGSASWTLSCGC